MNCTAICLPSHNKNGCEKIRNYFFTTIFCAFWNLIIKDKQELEDIGQNVLIHNPTMIANQDLKVFGLRPYNLVGIGFRNNQKATGKSLSLFDCLKIWFIR